MQESAKTKAALLQEMAALKQQISELEKAAAERPDLIPAREELNRAARLKSELKYRQLIEITRDLIYVADGKGRLTYLNPTLDKTLGYSREEWHRKPYTLLFAPEYIEAARDIFARAMQGETIPVYETEMIRKDGTKIPVEVNITTLYDTAGKFAGRYCVGRDITKRRQAELALLESETKFKSFAEQALVGTYLLQDGVFKYVNPKFAQMFGYTVEECLADMPVEKLVVPEEAANVREQARKRIAGEVEFVHYTFRGRKKNGEIFPVEIYGSASIHKGRPAAAGAILDITEREKAEEALRESDERFRALFDGSLDSVFIYDFDGKFLDLNQAALDKLGYERSDIQSLNFAFLMGEEQSLKTIPVVVELLKTGRQQKPAEYGLRCKDGSLLDFEIRSSLIYHNGEPYAIVGIARDITDRKRAEAEKRRNERLRGILEMAGAICHELNQPLQIISGNSEMLLKNIAGNDPLRQKLEDINRQIQRMGTITKKLMRIENYETEDYAGLSRIVSINKSSSPDSE